jgi:hypothetical protein
MVLTLIIMKNMEKKLNPNQIRNQNIVRRRKQRNYLLQKSSQLVMPMKKVIRKLLFQKLSNNKNQLKIKLISRRQKIKLILIMLRRKCQE